MPAINIWCLGTLISVQINKKSKRKMLEDNLQTGDEKWF